MIILSHRGFWRDPSEKNQPVAFDRTIAEGFGTETDIRDHGGKLVVSHDPPQGGEPSLDDLIGYFRGTALPLAINVKADGLVAPLGEAMTAAKIDWFAFDMSGPETIRYARANLPYFTRHSDIEPDPILYTQAAGVWLDAFENEWFDASVISAHLRNGKKVCVVSSELHGRDHADLWTMLGTLKAGDDLMLCTDFPDRAKEAFAQ